MMMLDDFVRVGDKPGGSVPGGLYVHRETRDAWIVKFPGSDRARNEVLAGRLYRLCGVRVPDLELVRLTTVDERGEPNVAVASRVVPNLRRPGRVDGRLAGLLDAFGVDCWLANWDVVGLEYDNVLVDGDGNAVRIDLGGSILFRAQGKPKGDAFGDVAVEIVSMRQPEINPQAASVFRDFGDHHAEASARMLRAADDETIAQAVAEVGLPSWVAARLIARRDSLIKHWEPCFPLH